MSKKQRNENMPLFKISDWCLHIKTWKVHFETLLIMLFAGRFVSGASEKTIENYHLVNNGKLSKGKITSRMKVGSKGTVSIDYKFHVDNLEYTGETNDEKYEIGDSLYVIYLQKNIQSIDHIHF